MVESMPSWISALRDVALILARRKSSITKLQRTGAAHLGGFAGKDEATMLLEQTADEEKETDELLNEMAGRPISKQLNRAKNMRFHSGPTKPPRQVAQPKACRRTKRSTHSRTAPIILAPTLPPPLNN